MNTEYISPAETARYVRKALGAAFPGVKFGVRPSVYSGGASIDVSWRDGPCQKRVERVAKGFEGADFDGTIDLKTNCEHWLLPDGTVELAHAEGTEGSRGVIPGFDSPQPIRGRRVSFGADYIFCTRHTTDWERVAAEAAALIRANGGCDGEPPNDRYGNSWVASLANAVAHEQHEGESVAAATRRVAFENGGRCDGECS